MKNKLQENILIELFVEHYNYAKESIEINDDTRCDICNKKIKSQDFTTNKDREIMHSLCFNNKQANR